MPIIKHYGNPGHLIVAWDCHFHLLTTIMPEDGTRGVYISTVGDYYRRFDGKRENDILSMVNCDSHYETLVFSYAGEMCDCNPDCGSAKPESWCEIRGRRSKTRAEANEQHALLVQKYERKIGNGWRPEPVKNSFEVD